MPNGVQQHQVVSQSTLNRNQGVTQVAMFKADGTPAPLVSQAAARADVAAMTSTAAITGGEPPTEAEFNQLRADVVAMRTVVNDLLAKLRTAGVIAT